MKTFFLVNTLVRFGEREKNVKDAHLPHQVNQAEDAAEVNNTAAVVQALPDAGANARTHSGANARAEG